jgi:hypothetical protein
MSDQIGTGIFYVLEGHTPVSQPDRLAWAKWMETADRQVAKTLLPGEVEVSTVFLGVNHRSIDPGAPMLFETMIFGGKHDRYMTRCTTWEQAEKMHEKAVELAKNAANA